MDKSINVRIGAGKFLLGSGAIESLCPEIIRLGGKPFFIGGPTSLEKIRDIVLPSLDAHGIKAVFKQHSGQCSRNWAHRYAREAQELGCNVIVGVGGGKCIDLAKLTTTMYDVPIITVPTSVATCVASSVLCVIYTDEGKPDGSVMRTREIECVIADTDIIAQAPKRLLCAGIFDSIAKYPEVMHKRTNANWDECDTLKYISIVNSKAIYDFLTGVMEEVLEKGAASSRFQDVVLTNLLHTSSVSGYSFGGGQQAIAHSLYYYMRMRFTKNAFSSLHGEIVAVGILVQMLFNGEDVHKVDQFRNVLVRYGLPVTLKEIGFVQTEKEIDYLVDYLLKETGCDESWKERLCRALKYIM